SGTFASKVDYPVGQWPRSVLALDLNGDGKPDLAITNDLVGGFPGTVSVLLNNGSGAFAAKVDYPTGVHPLSVAAADLNGDGKPALAVANFCSDNVSVLLNNGSGTFAAKVDYATGSLPLSVAAADLNGDGKPDLAVANQGSNTLSVMFNNGNGTFAAK